MEKQNTPLHCLPGGMVLNKKYCLGKVLGQGGFSITYEAWDANLGLHFAVKEYYPAGLVNRDLFQSPKVNPLNPEGEKIFEKGKEDCLKEARILAKVCDIPGIVSVRDFFQENNTAYIVMDYLEGITLKDYLKKEGRLSLEKTLDLLDPVMDALSLIHEKGLIHRDISPDNIMIGSRGEACLFDFGAARMVEKEVTKSLSVMLKPGYAPEEQYRSRGKQGPWTDVYALSATIYQCLTGITPEDSLQRLYEDELQRPSQLPKSSQEGAVLTTAQEKVLMKGLAVRAQDRLMTVEELKDGLKGDGGESREEEESEEKDPATLGEWSIKQEHRPLEEQEKEKKEPTNHNRKKKKHQRQKGILSRILLAAGCLTALLLIFSIIWQMTSTVMINGKKYSRKEENLSFYGVEMKEEDLEKMQTMPNLHSVSLNQCEITGEQMEQICRLHHLTSLSFFNVKGLETLAPVNELENLYRLTLENCGLTDEMLRDLEGGGTLAVLNIAENPQVTDLSAAGRMTGLMTLNASGTAVSDLSLLSKCQKMSILELNRCQVSDLSVLSQFPLLTQIEMDENQIQDLTPLAGLSHMTDISMSENQIQNLDPLSSMIELQYVDFSHNQIASLSGLSNCTVLKQVQMADNELGDIQVLEKSADSLQVLDVSDNRITEIKALEKCMVLERVDVSRNELTDLSPFAGHSSLISLEAEGNQISDISGLSGCSQLQRLNLSYNQISDISVLSEMKPEEYNFGQGAIVSLHGNQITDLSPLPDTVEYYYLTLYDNPIETYEPVSRLKGDVLAFTCEEDTDVTPIAQAEFYHCTVIDAPLDRQVKVKESLGEFTTTFATAEEFEAQVAALKNEGDGTDG
ncbi:MAG: leucine-rich repeat domain-containing protein [Ruminococcus sp.]|jgi:serine/threonine protein kinase/Leucine-rich repeat (LRR) protein